MYRQAATQLGLALDQSAYIGDRWRDVQPAQEAGGLGILVPGAETPEADIESARTHLSDVIRIAESLDDAVHIALTFVGAAATAAVRE